MAAVIFRVKSRIIAFYFKTQQTGNYQACHNKNGSVSSPSPYRFDHIHPQTTTATVIAIPAATSSANSPA
jgi:hypothetical protein